MKKIILVAAIVLGFAVAASAQPRAIGLRGGWGAEASYQHSFGADFLQADLGLNTFDSIHGSVVYNFMIAQPSWTSRGEWGFYAGPGAAVGMKLGNSETDGYFHVAAAGMVGLEYTFWFPLQLSLDLKPTLGFGFNHGFHWGVMPAFGVRYRF
ncbi:MAG: hypothetical protein J6Q37_06240 [Bacteroidales bacterium]|nr:hypothetical protein [Bacteroidales bacterium]